MSEQLPSFEARLDERDAHENHAREEAAARIASMRDGPARDAATAGEQERIKAFEADKARILQARAAARTGNQLAGSRPPSANSPSRPAPTLSTAPPPQTPMYRY